MAGIERLHIDTAISGSGGWRFWEGWRRWKTANHLYRQAFPTLLPGDELAKLTQDEFKARYDTDLGIDLILWFGEGFSATVQEKYLYTKYNTVTVEYMQNRFTEEPGDWFNMRCQYYFVGYDTYHLPCSTNPRAAPNRWRKNRQMIKLEQEMETGICSICGRPFKFDPWRLLNWPNVQRETAQGHIQWGLTSNMKDGARSNFRHARFNQFPPSCVVASSGIRQLTFC